MQVFKLFFKIINKNKVSVFATLFIAFAFSIMFVKTNDSIKIEKANITIIDEDQSELSKGLISHMEKTSNVKSFEKDEIEDALFYRDIEYVLYIPSGYETAVKANQEIELEKKQIPDSASAYIVDNYAQSFTNTARGYLAYDEAISTKDAIEKANNDLNIKVEGKNIAGEKTEDIQFYFNFLSYSFANALIWGIGIVMISMNKVDIKRRNVVSPISNLKMNVQLGLASATFGVVLFVISTIFAYTVFGSGMTTPGAYLYLVNLFVYLIPSTGLAYLIGSMFKKAEAISGVSNIVCLGLAFLGGAFVPQMLLSDSVLQVSKFLPSYWFVNANDRIRDLSNLNFKHLEPIYHAMGIQILFGVIFFALALIISKYRRRNVI